MARKVGTPLFAIGLTEVPAVLSPPEGRPTAFGEVPYSTAETRYLRTAGNPFTGGDQNTTAFYGEDIDQRLRMHDQFGYGTTRLDPSIPDDTKGGD